MRNKLIKTLLVIIVLSIVATSSFTHMNKKNVISTLKVKDKQPKGYVVIIIDDFGNNGNGTEEMINIGIPITAAVMPGLEYSAINAQRVHEKGFDVILHVPMEPLKGKASWLGPNAITSNLSSEEIDQRIKTSLRELQFAIGMNNHMGSKITQDEKIMRQILNLSKENNLIFVDSVTNENSVVSKISKEVGCESYSRDVFLDNIKSVESIRMQLNKLGDVALKKGYAIGIGHVGVEGGIITARAIKDMENTLKAKGIEFITLSQLKTRAGN